MENEEKDPLLTQEEQQISEIWVAAFTAMNEKCKEFGIRLDILDIIHIIHEGTMDMNEHFIRPAFDPEFEKTLDESEFIDGLLEDTDKFLEDILTKAGELTPGKGVSVAHMIYLVSMVCHFMNSRLKDTIDFSRNNLQNNESEEKNNDR